MIEKRIQGGKQSEKKGPFQLIEDEEELALHRRGEKPRRKFSCPHYHHCLALAAALNWDSFTCRNCCGEMNKALIWRAHHEKKRDNMVNVICDLPDIHFIHFSTHLHQTATLINSEAIVTDDSLTAHHSEEAEEDSMLDDHFLNGDDCNREEDRRSRDDEQ